MSDRRDKKGRLLRTGESQRNNGQYMYRYTDSRGERHTVYSWALVATDKLPTGKTGTKPLRDLEKEIQRNVEDGIFTEEASGITLDSAFEQMMEDRIDLRPTTRSNYQTIYKKMIHPIAGNKTIDSFRKSTVKGLYRKLYVDGGYAISSILSAHNIMFSIFARAVEDHILRENPAENAFLEISRCISERPPKERHALTIEQQRALVQYVYQSPVFKEYANLVTVLLGTGLRIGEALGLRLEDCDFEHRQIHINHTLLYKNTNGAGYHYQVMQPKTKAGYRTIPMLQEVQEALTREINKPKRPSWEPFVVENYQGFIFLNSRDKVITPQRFHGVLQQIRDSYNHEEVERSRLENRSPVLLPCISPHILRHTFCTRVCENSQDLKVIQNVMGHRKITTTMDVYNEATQAAKQQSFQGLEGKFTLS